MSEEGLQDCPCCMNESGEGRIYDSNYMCGVCNNTTLVTHDIWKSWTTDPFYGPWPEKNKSPKAVKREATKIALDLGHELNDWQKVLTFVFEDKIQQTRCKKCLMTGGMDLTESPDGELFGKIFTHKCGEW